jgi:hypothetical protein
LQAAAGGAARDPLVVSQPEVPRVLEEAGFEFSHRNPFDALRAAPTQLCHRSRQLQP